MTNKTKKITPYLRLGISFLLCVGMGLGLMLLIFSSGKKIEDVSQTLFLYGGICIFAVRRITALQRRPLFFSLVWMAICVVFSCVFALFFEKYSMSWFFYLLMGCVSVGITALEAFLVKIAVEKNEKTLKKSRITWAAIGFSSILLLHSVLFVLSLFESIDVSLHMGIFGCLLFPLYLVTYDLIRKISPYPYTTWMATLSGNIPFWIMVSFNPSFITFATLGEEILMGMYLCGMIVIDLGYLAVHLIKKKKEQPKDLPSNTSPDIA